MRRGVTSNKTRDLLFKLRDKIPGLTLRTTLIAGYPNETEKDFEDLCGFIKEVRFDRLGVFTFSVEENTSSYILGNPVPEKIKLERKNKIMEIQKDISTEINTAFIGKSLKVLVDRIEGDYYVARSYRDAPEVDGEVLIPVKNNKLKTGEFYSVEINDSDEYDLYAELPGNRRLS
jgi:ribosomal protein S12 methylthiotransferase